MKIAAAAAGHLNLAIDKYENQFFTESDFHASVESVMTSTSDATSAVIHSHPYWGRHSAKNCNNPLQKKIKLLTLLPVTFFEKGGNGWLRRAEDSGKNAEGHWITGPGSMTR